MVAAGVVTLLATAVAIGALVILHVLPTGLSPLRDAVSHYGISPQRRGYRVLTMAMAAAALAAFVGIDDLHPGRATAQIEGALMAVAYSRAAISWYPMDEPGRPPTRTGMRHFLLAVLAFAGITFAAIRFGVAIGRSHEWPHLRAAVVPIDVILGAGVVGMVAAKRVPKLGQWFGAIERVFYLGALAWFVFVGIGLVSS